MPRRKKKEEQGEDDALSSARRFESSSATKLLDAAWASDLIGPQVTHSGHPLDHAARRGKGPGDSSGAARRASERASEWGVPKTCNYGPGVHQAVPPPVASRRPRPTSSVSLFISVSFLRLSLTSFSRFSTISPPPAVFSPRAVFL